MSDTLDKFLGGNFKRVTVLYGEFEGSNPVGQINECDEDLDSETQSREMKKRVLAPIDTQGKRILQKYVKKRVEESPVRFMDHIGFRNSFYRNNRYNVQGTRDQERIRELSQKEQGLYTKYANKFYKPSIRLPFN